jgi:hypothetical protein
MRRALDTALNQETKEAAHPAADSGTARFTPATQEVAGPALPAAAGDIAMSALHEICESVIQAMSAGKRHDPSWKALAEECQRDNVSPHPLLVLTHHAERSDPETVEDLRQRGWTVLEEALVRHPDLMRRPPGSNGDSAELPVCGIARFLRPWISPGDLARDLVQLNTDATYLQAAEWWTTLLAGLRPSTVRTLVRSLESTLKTPARSAMRAARARHWH